MVARSPSKSPIPTHNNSDENGTTARPVVDRRQLLTKATSWMKFSWRKSKDSLMDDISEDENDIDRSHLSQDENDSKLPKHVHFSENDGGDDHEEGVDEEVALVITEIPANPDDAISEEDAKTIWYHDFDFKRFEKDRVLCSMDYTNSRKLNKAYVEDEHSVRGIEHLCDASLQRRQFFERKDLIKALKAEEARQKEVGTPREAEKEHAPKHWRMPEYNKVKCDDLRP
ncbi:MAG: hypothetical protein SGARI_002954 [Bacillariaceae sp.]